MKRLLSLLCAIALVATMSFGCKKTEPPSPTEPAPTGPSLGIDLSVYPIYDNLTDDEKIIWDTICTAIKNHSTDRIHIGTYSNQYEHDNAKKRFEQMYRELVYSCPDYFWVNLYDYELHTVEDGSTRRLELQLRYVLNNSKSKEYAVTYNEKVDQIVAAAKEQPDLFHQVLYVYDTIMDGAEYDYDLAESNDIKDLGLSAYGCLVEGKTICSGYALAFRSIMEKLGIECGVEFNSYQYLSMFVGHVWNYCKLDDEYYYFDLTWDDTDDDQYPSSHLFFGLNREDLEKASYYVTSKSPIPKCNGTKYNYYRYMGLNFATYDFAAVAKVLREHKDDKVIILRFDSRAEVEKAAADLIDNGRIADALPGFDSVLYAFPETDLHLWLEPMK